ncbi:maleylpyruvate isomerase N-terminal domain-containing protein [Beutenbergia cavernae]|nr:maleylpyruvate isomerase N-terminal domain-containing protein [Beutenbergia cavernae]
MATTLAIEQHLAALARAGSALVEHVERAGDGATVPTCPAWTARHLLAHQATIHRWATSHVRGDDPAEPSEESLAAGQTDLPGYYRSGLDALLEALEAAPVDLQAVTFLNDAPPPRAFWARRQAHETTIHAVDAVAAVLGRTPSSAEAAEAAGIDAELALDGIDELLAGFLTRNRYPRLAAQDRLSLAVSPTDAAEVWLVDADEHLAAVRVSSATVPSRADAEISGTAVQLYLGLWNRGTEISAGDRPDVIDLWRGTQRVR